MDVIFNCPKCDQELAVDSSGAGSEINCPSCGEAIVIPAPEKSVLRPGLESLVGAPRMEGARAVLQADGLEQDQWQRPAN